MKDRNPSDDMHLTPKKRAKLRLKRVVYLNSTGLMEFLNGVMVIFIGVWYFILGDHTQFLTGIGNLTSMILMALLVLTGVLQLAAFLLKMDYLRSILAYLSAMLWTTMAGLLILDSVVTMITSVSIVFTVTNLWINYRLNSQPKDT